MKKRIKLFLAAAIAAIVSVAAGFYSYQATQENLLAQVELSALEANIEALTNPEGGMGDYRLKKAECKCKNGNSGHTANCVPNGDLEKCTSSMSGCYEVGLIRGLGLLCEGDARKY